MIRIPWTERVANVEDFRRAGAERCLIKRGKRRQLKFLGHVVRAEKLKSDRPHGKTDGTRAR